MARECSMRLLATSAIVCSFIACISIAVALGTQHWQNTHVDRVGLMKIVPYKPQLQELLNTNELYYDRSRGLFLRCGAVIGKSGVIEIGVCEQDSAFEHAPVFNFSSVSDKKSREVMISKIKLRDNLLIAVIALLVGSVGVALLSGLLGILGLLREYKTMFTVSVSLDFCSTICAGCAMAIFHGVDFIEKTDLAIFVFPAVLNTIPDYRELTSHTTVSFGYSYFGGWFAVLASSVAAILFLYARTRLATFKSLQSPSTMLSSSTSSLFSTTSHKPAERKRKSSRSQESFDSIPSAYDMMEAGISGTGSEQGSTQAPSTDDWRPHDELPPNDALYT